MVIIANKSKTKHTSFIGYQITIFKIKFNNKQKIKRSVLLVSYSQKTNKILSLILYS